jgi:hypothetical protein
MWSSQLRGAGCRTLLGMKGGEKDGMGVLEIPTEARKGVFVLPTWLT